MCFVFFNKHAVTILFCGVIMNINRLTCCVFLNIVLIKLTATNKNKRFY